MQKKKRSSLMHTNCLRASTASGNRQHYYSQLLYLFFKHDENSGIMVRSPLSTCSCFTCIFSDDPEKKTTTTKTHFLSINAHHQTLTPPPQKKKKQTQKLPLNQCISSDIKNTHTHTAKQNLPLNLYTPSEI